MTCYKDKTWCPYRACCNFNECSDALTKEVEKVAEEWWITFKSKDPAPISVFTEIPKCYNKYDQSFKRKI